MHKEFSLPTTGMHDFFAHQPTNLDMDLNNSNTNPTSPNLDDLPQPPTKHSILLLTIVFRSPSRWLTTRNYQTAKIYAPKYPDIQHGLLSLQPPQTL